MFLKRLRQAGLVILAAVVGVGLTAAPAGAAESAPNEDSEQGGAATAALEANVQPAPAGVSGEAWSAAFGSAQAEHGDGDKAYLEALKVAAPAAVNYCTSYSNYAPGNGKWYKIPEGGNSYNCLMEVGITGPGVYVLQQTLNYCYGKNLALDSDFGNATYTALISAQLSAGITADGVYGPTTRKNLKWWGGGSVCTKGSSLGL